MTITRLMLVIIIFNKLCLILGYGVLFQNKSIFIVSSIGSGLEKGIDQNIAAPGITDIIFSPDIYIPISAFFVLIIVTIVLRKLFYK